MISVSPCQFVRDMNTSKECRRGNIEKMLFRCSKGKICSSNFYLIDAGWRIEPLYTVFCFDESVTYFLVSSLVYISEKPLSSINSQAPFDDLIASSLDALEQTSAKQSAWDNADPCPIRKTFESIDDFLAQYRHNRSSILSFLSCLDEPDNAVTSSGITTDCSIPIPIHKIPSQTSSKRSSPTTYAVSDAGEEQAVATPTNRARNHQIHPQPDRKNGLSSRSGESKEEIRRSKNREYQRRFREKKMRLELQRQLLASKHP